MDVTLTRTEDRPPVREWFLPNTTDNEYPLAMVGLETLSGALPSLIGALFGVLLGQLLTVWWDRRKRRVDRRERRRQTERSIAGELRVIHEDLDRLDDPEIEPDFPYPTAAYESSIASGRFSLIAEDDQLDIARAYEHVSRAQDTQDQLQRARLGDEEDDPRYQRHLRIRFNEHVEALQGQLPDVIDKLDNCHDG